MELTIEKPISSEAASSLLASDGLNGATPKTPTELAEIVARFASSDSWLDKVRLNAKRRWYERLYCGPDHDIWVISWLPGQSTGFHDHGKSAGAFVVATGTLEEHRPGERTAIYPGRPRAFGRNYAHDVRNVSVAPAISIHAYSPPLDEMNEYELDGEQLIPRERGPKPAHEWRVDSTKSSYGAGAQSIDETLLAARSRLRRLSPTEVREALLEGEAVLVDIRPEAQRAKEGSIPGAVIVERNVLEWRFDPSSTARLPVATDHDLQIIVFCSEGYTSSLAAVALQGLGLWRTTDMIGGFHAWRTMGFPSRVITSVPGILGGNMS
jgi:rhodanese-related sulfurtransferase/mannose-6-phosphate isomerase-like protein (cupin superfamily)